MLWEIVTCAAVLYFIATYLFSSNPNESIDKLPGPPRWPFIGSTLEFVGHTPCEIFDKILEFPKLYGNIVGVKVFNRYIVHIYNPKDIEVVLSHSRNITKNRPYEFMKPWLGAGLLLSTGSKWHKSRKILTPAFHFEILKNFSRVFEEESRNMVKDIRSRLQRGADVLDVMPFLSDYTLYAICETAMGTRLNSENSVAKLEYKNSTLAIGSLVIRRLTHFWLHFNIIFNLSPSGRQFNKCLKQNFSFTDSVIEERRKQKTQDGDKDMKESEGKRKLALLDLLLEAESKGEIDLEGIRDEVNTFMFEGHDTTAMALTFGLMLLADHEDVQERIFEECKVIFGESERSANTSDIGEMKYLEAVIKEILRLYPSVPFIGRLITEEFMLDDVRLTKGTEVLVHIYDLQRREDLFPEPEKFKPERFLNGDKMRFSYVPFSAGPRNCIGQRFAMQEMKYMLSDIVRHFKMSPIEKGFRPKIKTDLVLRPNEPIYVKFASR